MQWPIGNLGENVLPERNLYSFIQLHPHVPNQITSPEKGAAGSASDKETQKQDGGHLNLNLIFVEGQDWEFLGSWPLVWGLKIKTRIDLQKWQGNPI